MKRIVSLILSLVMIMALSVPVMADGEEYTFSLLANGDAETTVAVGETVDVTLEITENSGLTSMDLYSMQDYVCYEERFLEVVSITGHTDDDEVEITSASQVDIDPAMGEVYVNRSSLTGVEVELPFVAVTIRFRALENGTTDVTHDVIELLNNGVDYPVVGEKATIIIGTGVAAEKSVLTFETNGGSAIPKVTVDKGETVNLAAYTPTKAGNSFKGWYTDAALTNLVTSVTLNSDMTVYAKWAAAAANYTITFQTNGGSAVSKATFPAGTVVNLTGYTTTKSGSTFDGWYKESSFTTKLTDVTVNENMTVYAKWTAASNPPGGGPGGGGGGGGATVKEFTVSFKNADGTEIAKVSKEAGTKIDLSAYSYKKDGYKFAGWYLDKDFKNPASDFSIAANTTLYAKWVEVVAGTVMGQYHPEILTTDHYAYVMGREGNMICPEDNITRAEVATIFFRLLTEEVRTSNITKENVFNDVNASDWHNTAVSTLAKLGIINGRTEVTFEPNAFITRAEFATIAARFSNAPYTNQNLFKDVNGHWAEEYINKAAAYGWIVGDGGKFRPNDNITRAEVMTIVNRVLGRLPESEADLLPEMNKWKDNSDTNAWYYLAVQEATNSHNCMQKADGVHEEWIEITETPDWSKFE